MPIFRSVNCIQVLSPKMCIGPPNGITEIDKRAMVIAKKGAVRYRNLLT